MPPGRPKIDPVRERSTLLDQPTRREIAKACRRAPQGVAELEKTLGRAGLKDRVEKMESWSILERAGSTPRGKPAYVLASGWEDDLDAVNGRIASAALVGRSFMILTGKDLAPAADCLAREHGGDLAWVGVVGDREGLVAGLGGSGEADVDQIERTLRAAGVDCEVKSVGGTASGAEVAPFLRGIGLRGG